MLNHLHLDMLTLAVRRYPDVEPGLALMFFTSDRQRACGALKPFSRRGGEVQCTKDTTGRDGRIFYKRSVDKPAYQRFPQREFDLATAFGIDDVAETIQIETVPAKREAYACHADYWDFQSQRGRKMVADMLRRMRKGVLG